MKLEITKASEVQVKSVEWLWYPYIPYLSIIFPIWVKA